MVSAEKKHKRGDSRCQGVRYAILKRIVRKGLGYENNLVEI